MHTLISYFITTVSLQCKNSHFLQHYIPIFLSRCVFMSPDCMAECIGEGWQQGLQWCPPPPRCLGGVGGWLSRHALQPGLSGRIWMMKSCAASECEAVSNGPWLAGFLCISRLLSAALNKDTHWHATTRMMNILYATVSTSGTTTPRLLYTSWGSRETCSSTVVRKFPNCASYHHVLRTATVC